MMLATAWLVAIGLALTLYPLLVRDRLSRNIRQRLVLVVFALLVLANIPAHLSDLGPYDSRAANGAIRSLMAQVEKAGLPGPTSFDGSNLVFAEPYSGPVLAALAEVDAPIRAGDASFARQLGEHRRRQDDERYSLQVRSGDGATDLGIGESVLASAIGPGNTPVTVVLKDLSVSDA